MLNIKRLLGLDKNSNLDNENPEELKNQALSGIASEQQQSQLIEKLLFTAFAEQKRARRWGVFFKLLTFGYLFFALLLFFTGSNFGGVPKVSEPHVALVEVKGVIAEDELASANRLVSGLRRAFEAEHSKGVILAINSPGGSPVQAGYVYDEIFRLKAKHEDKKVYAVISDIGASGAYYIAAAADQIYANQASLVGSIGVTASGFGFVDTLDKLGIERRHFTAGEHKAFLDPFSPLKDDEKDFWQSVLDATHGQFIKAVKNGRGDRLADEAMIFSGLVWSGEEAKDYGLVDGLGSAGYVARDIIGVEEIRNYSVRPSPLEDVVKMLGVSVGRGIGLFVKEQSSLHNQFQ